MDVVADDSVVYQSVAKFSLPARPVVFLPVYFRRMTPSFAAGAKSELISIQVYEISLVRIVT